jgi:hypothetical protein
MGSIELAVFFPILAGDAIPDWRHRIRIVEVEIIIGNIGHLEIF